MSEPFDGIKQGLIEAITIEKVMKENKKLRIILRKVITAWEALPGGRAYTPRTVESWLRDDMASSIDKIREVLNEKP